MGFDSLAGAVVRLEIRVAEVPWALPIGAVTAFAVGLAAGWLMIRLLYGRMAADHLLAVAVRPFSYTALLSCVLIAAWAVAQA